MVSVLHGTYTIFFYLKLQIYQYMLYTLMSHDSCMVWLLSKKKNFLHAAA